MEKRKTGRESTLHTLGRRRRKSPLLMGQRRLILFFVLDAPPLRRHGDLPARPSCRQTRLATLKNKVSLVSSFLARGKHSRHFQILNDQVVCLLSRRWECCDGRGRSFRRAFKASLFHALSRYVIYVFLYGRVARIDGGCRSPWRLRMGGTHPHYQGIAPAFSLLASCLVAYMMDSVCGRVS